MNKFEKEFKRLMDEVDAKRLEIERDKPMVKHLAYSVHGVSTELTDMHDDYYGQRMISDFKSHLSGKDGLGVLSVRESAELTLAKFFLGKSIFDRGAINKSIERFISYCPDVQVE